ncbi:DNA-binding protein [Acinetobacter towneri]|uniref:DNA-binding protein n=1 Tax=Acinetobacter towneri TaxID=202956 RepID=UPI001F61CC77|nr:DNA-binding protein [Acinetobacter towneri]UNT61054.1 DNA-binding protein [Acinetobacter towneri]
MNMLAQIQNDNNPDQVTMTSLEIVQFINQSRINNGDITLVQHKDFMRKVPKVLGGGVGKFSHTYTHPQNGQEYPCYRFPKREACLMAMSYSYEIQAQVFDRMTAMEDHIRSQSNTIAISFQDFNQLKNQVEQMQYQISLLTRKGKQKVQITDDNIIESKIKQDILRIVHANPIRGVTLREIKQNSRAVQRDLEIAEKIINQLIDFEEIKLVIIPSPSGRGKPRNAYFLKGER